jgi:hypothetical protein
MTPDWISGRSSLFIDTYLLGPASQTKTPQAAAVFPLMFSTLVASPASSPHARDR